MDESSEPFWNLIRASLPDSTIVNYILIAEVRDSDIPALRVTTSNGMTPWLAEGMLNFASDMIVEEQL